MALKNKVFKIYAHALVHNKLWTRDVLRVHVLPLLPRRKRQEDDLKTAFMIKNFNLLNLHS